MGVVLKTAPVIISVSRHQGTWTANSHVSPYSLLPSRRKKRQTRGDRKTERFLCLSEFVLLHTHFYVSISMCLRTVLLAPWVVCEHECIDVCVCVLVDLQGNKPGHSGRGR